MSIGSLTQSYKRSADETDRSLPQNEKKIKVEESFDFFPLFYTIISSSQSSTETTALLLQNHEVIVSMQMEPYRKIKESFQLFLQDPSKKLTEENQEESLKVLKELYIGSLFNSATKSELEKTAAELPTLQEKLKTDIKNQIEIVLKESSDLIQKIQGNQSPEEIREFLSEIDSLQQKLNSFRVLRQYTNFFENQRMLDLAVGMRTRETSEQYPQIISDYPALVKQIATVSKEINSVSKRIQELNLLKLHLQKNLSQFAKEDQENPLEIRFINAFGTAFYNTFAEHFWTLLQNSADDLEINKALKETQIQLDHYDLPSACMLWENYFPEYEFSDWILRVLSSMPSSQLDKLEQDLQKILKDSNALRENRDLDKEIKTQLQSCYLEQMQKICSQATTSQFTTLSELKGYLNQ